MFKASIVGLITILSTPAIAGRINADVNCLQGAEDMQFDCMFMLMQDAAPLQGAEFTVLPQMPSMPMAHNTQPIPAMPLADAGRYHVPIVLDMLGEWALKLEFSAPQRDVVVIKVQFPAAVTAKTPSHSHSHTNTHTHSHKD